MNCIKCNHIVILPKHGSTYCVNCNAYYCKNSLFDKQFSKFTTISIVFNIKKILHIEISRNVIFRFGKHNGKTINSFSLRELHDIDLKQDKDFVELIELNYKEYLSYINNLIFE